MANTFNLGNGSWAQKTEKLLAYNAENDNYKPLPFDFDRASTATRVNKQGLIETVGVDEPRIDFLNNTKGHLLLEPSRQNSFLYSNQFDTTWNENYLVLTGGQIGINGDNDAWLVSGFSGTAEKRLRQNPNLVGNTAISVYAKKGTNDFLWLRGVTDGFNKRTFFNLSNGTIGQDASVSSNMIDMGNGWYRCEAVFNQSSGFQFYIGLSDSDGAATTSTTGNIYIQYAQAEAGSYATSYIPTQGSAVTRSADFTKIVNSPILQGTNQFTLFFEAKDFLIVNGTNVSFSNLMLVFGAGESAYDSGTGIHIYDRTWFYYNGSSAVFVGVCYNGLVDSKFAISYDGTKFTRYAGGVKLGEYTASASMVNWDTITTGANTDVENDDRVFNLSDLRLYNTALTDAELIALTS